MATVVSPIRAVFLSLALWLLCLLAGAQQNPPSKIIALRASRMLDVKSGSIVHDPVVLIQDDKITAAGASLKIPAGAEVVNLGDVTLLPGTHRLPHSSDGPHLRRPPGLRLDFANEVAGFSRTRRRGRRSGYLARRFYGGARCRKRRLRLCRRRAAGCDQPGPRGRSAHASGNSWNCGRRQILPLRYLCRSCRFSDRRPNDQRTGGGAPCRPRADRAWREPAQSLCGLGRPHPDPRGDPAHRRGGPQVQTKSGCPRRQPEGIRNA